MSFNVKNEQVTIFKDERGINFAYVTNKELDENGEPYLTFARINIKFRKGVEVKNRTKIKINEGFLTFYQSSTGEFSERTGKEIKRNVFKIVVMDFDVLEDGIDEPYGYKSHKQNNSEKMEESADPINFDDLEIYGGEDDDLPF